ncbi:conserved hypothetical protein [Pediculus humanus corporis]|uniref:Ribosomal RNA-processing protein 14/surfeit locus protein 6 C-terminal domain-containing protein n=1 Tax=Pediculus humanus subsp. corporis TaxID=121224 RepID=E0VGE2_PEDHC|nr:uncharacterized protein Phum_PHUM179890 [Pediculus humanus corporis]EEB12448.1 conserved hypothetical protein [Pediculus humanus corporis]
MELKGKHKNKIFTKAQIKEMEKFYTEKYSFIHDLLQQYANPSKSENGNDSNDDKAFKLDELPPRLNPALKNDKQPAKTPEELLARLSKLKGVPKLSYKDKLLKKSLKNKLLKKAKKERRRQKMPKNIKSENGDVAPKKQKPVLNSEGQVIYSKFDFSVLGAKKTDLKKPKVDPKIMLQKLKEQEKMVKNLKEEGKIDEAKQIVERKAIKTALMKMEGVKNTNFTVGCLMGQLFGHNLGGCGVFVNIVHKGDLSPNLSNALRTSDVSSPSGSDFSSTTVSSSNEGNPRLMARSLHKETAAVLPDAGNIPFNMK